MHIIGAVGAVAAAANGYSPYGYYRHSRPVVVVPQPRTVVVDRPVVVEKVIERPIVVEKIMPATPALPNDFYSHKLGATFRMENMQIPGYKFRAARLTSNPVAGSPLTEIGLVKGDVVTRLNNDSIDSLDMLDRHERNTLIRFIKTGTTKVRQDRIYIPTDDELHSAADEVYFAP